MWHGCILHGALAYHVLFRKIPPGAINILSVFSSLVSLSGASSSSHQLGVVRRSGLAAERPAASFAVEAGCFGRWRRTGGDLSHMSTSLPTSLIVVGIYHHVRHRLYCTESSCSCCFRFWAPVRTQQMACVDGLPLGRFERGAKVRRATLDGRSGRVCGAHLAYNLGALMPRFFWSPLREF